MTDLDCPRPRAVLQPRSLPRFKRERFLVCSGQAEGLAKLFLPLAHKPSSECQFWQDPSQRLHSMAAKKTKAEKVQSLWLAPTPSKIWGELFFLAYSPFWIVLCLGIVVPFKLYERFGKLEYLLLGLVSALPCLVAPLFIVGKADGSRPLLDRFWVKANLWVFIFGFVGNYFWTHYFYTVLGATYTFPSWNLNHVPLTTFFLTHCYFLLYHAISNITLRRLRHAIKGVPSRLIRWILQAAWVFLLSYLTALTEAVTISNFPYYDIVDRPVFYTMGSLFYAIYFFVSFPMFIRVDEEASRPWSLAQVAIDSLGAAMLVTIVLDLWRIMLGPIVEIPGPPSYKECLTYGLPWLR